MYKIYNFTLIIELDNRLNWILRIVHLKFDGFTYNVWKCVYIYVHCLYYALLATGWRIHILFMRAYKLYPTTPLPYITTAAIETNGGDPEEREKNESQYTLKRTIPRILNLRVLFVLAAHRTVEYYMVCHIVKSQEDPLRQWWFIPNTDLRETE